MMLYICTHPSITRNKANERVSREKTSARRELHQTRKQKRTSKSVQSVSKAVGKREKCKHSGGTCKQISNRDIDV